MKNEPWEIIADGRIGERVYCYTPGNESGFVWEDHFIVNEKTRTMRFEPLGGEGFRRRIPAAVWRNYDLEKLGQWMIDYVLAMRIKNRQAG